MTESIQSILGWYRTYYADGFYLVMAVVSYLYLFAHCPELRKKFLVPMALVMFLVLNPILHKYVYSKIIYWRLFWMFPTGILIALAAVKMVKSSKGTAGKIVVLAGVCALILIKGANVYTERGFEPITNAEKVPEEVKEICDLMLELEENPKCIVPETLFSDVRQYSGEVKMLYGRDVRGFLVTPDKNIWSVWREMEKENPNYERILTYAEQEGCSLLITYKNRPLTQENLDDYGYCEQKFGGEYCVYWKR